MSASGLFVIGVLVTALVVGALSLLFYAEILDGRDAARREAEQGDPTRRAASRNLLDLARESGRFTTWLDAVRRAGLEPTLTGPGPITAFAPTDEAFTRLPDGTIDALLAEPSVLEAVLTYHLVEGRLTASEAGALRSAPTLNGETLPVSVDGAVHVHDATVLDGDFEACNGVLHAVDRVLLPAAI